MHIDPRLPFLLCVDYLMFSYHSKPLPTYILTTFLFTRFPTNVIYKVYSLPLSRSYSFYFPDPVIYDFHLCLHFSLQLMIKLLPKQ